MLAYTYVEHGKFELRDKPRPVLRDARDAIVRVTLASICTSDLHIKHGSVPRAVPGITVGHEMVGIVDEVGEAVTAVRPGDRVTVNVETFCGDCFFCRNGWVNNCTDPEGGWALGCRIDGGQAEYVRVPYADQGLNRIPDGVTDRQALFVGDVLATGYWAARIAEIRPGDTVLILGAGPTGLCTLQCVQLLQPGRIIVCDRDPGRLAFVRAHAPQVLADYWAVLSGRTKLRREPTQQQFEPLVTAPMVSVTSRVVYILRHLIAGTAAKMSQLFSRQQTRSTNVATFLALLELVRGGRVKLDDEGRLTMQRGRIQRDKEKE